MGVCLTRNQLKKLEQAVQSICDAHYRESDDGCSTVTIDTHKRRCQIVKRFYRQVTALGFKLNQPTSLKEKHIRAWIQYHKQQGTCDKTTLLNYSKHLRTFCRWINKPQFVQLLNRAYEIISGQQKMNAAPRGNSSRRTRLRDSLKRVLAHNDQVTHHARKNKIVGFSTVAQRKETLYRIINDVYTMGFKIDDVHSLKEKHIVAWFLKKEAQGAGGATLQTAATHLRRLAEYIGKQGLVGDPREYLRDPRKYERTYVATRDKSDRGKKLNAEAVIEKLTKKDPIVGHQARTALAFGLRLEEACVLRPYVADRGDHLYVRNGTKGGRARKVKIRTQEQRDALDDMKLWATSKTRSTIPRGYNYDEWKNHVYYILRDVGLTKADLGYTFHGLRHAFANDLYEALTGSPTPIRTEGTWSPPDNDDEARQVLVDELGHARPSISTAYIGSVRKKGTSSKK